MHLSLRPIPPDTTKTSAAGSALSLPLLQRSRCSQRLELKLGLRQQLTNTLPQRCQQLPTTGVRATLYSPGFSSLSLLLFVLGILSFSLVLNLGLLMSGLGSCLDKAINQQQQQHQHPPCSTLTALSWGWHCNQQSTLTLNTWMALQATTQSTLSLVIIATVPIN